MSQSPGQGLADYGAQVVAADGAEENAEASTEELLRDAEQAFGEIFSIRPPRDIFAGMWSGATCIVSGVFLGVAGLISQPFEGFRNNGLRGCLRGFALGACTGLFFAVTGVFTGIAQAIRGVVATPRAICMISQGQTWDTDTSRWAVPLVYSLPEEAGVVLAPADDDDEDYGASSRNKSVVDTKYYDYLELKPSATQREIRVAYFQQSKKWHPDKNLDLQAKERFQAISEAYQVLSDPGRRRAYDAKGRDAAGEGFIDARIFFSVLFGSDVLEAYIGQLKIAEWFGEDGLNLDGNDADNSLVDGLSQRLREMEQQDARSERRQLRRQVTLAVKLAERLDDRADSENERTWFCTHMREEAAGFIKRDASLQRFLAEIGWLYKNYADWELGREDSSLGRFGGQALGAVLRSHSRSIRQKASTAKLAVASYLRLRKIVAETDEAKASEGHSSSNSSPNGKKEGEEGDADDSFESLNSAMPTFMETLWSLAVHDINGTLDTVIRRVLNDKSVEPVARRRRIERLHELGDIFLGAAETARVFRESEDNHQCKRFEEAFAASVAAGDSTSKTE